MNLRNLAHSFETNGQKKFFFSKVAGSSLQI